MPYKLLVIDDEALIRESIPNIVDWEAMGFEIVAALEDGREAIGYIDKMPVDVVFTDIMMTFVSGLELARHIYECKPDIKVVIISGYQDFEFARQAIKYNVVHYLLKPTRLDELKSVFEDIRKQLDKEKEEQEKNEKINLELRYYEDIKPLLQEQFFTDIILGALRNESEIEKRLKLIGLNIEPDRSKYCILEIAFPAFKEYIVHSWEYGKEGFYPAIKNFVNTTKEEIRFFTAGFVRNRMFVLAIAPGEMEDFELVVRMDSFYDSIKADLKELMKLETQFEFHGIFYSLYDAAAKFSPAGKAYKSKSIFENTGEMVDNSRMTEQQKLFISYISAGNIESVRSLFDSFLEELKSVDLKIVQNFVIDLFSMLSNKLRDIGIDINAITRDRFFYNTILNMPDVHEIKEWGSSILNEIVGYVSQNCESADRKMIQKAKEYVREHCCEDISLEDIADYVFLNPTYLCRLFKQLTGENFTDYLVKERMERAMKLLQDAQYKIYEICSLIGYKSNKYFTKIFKQYTGYTPSEFREKK